MSSTSACLESSLAAADSSQVRGVELGERADRIGAIASAVCAVHCASWPFLLAVLPALGSSLLASEWLERGFVVFATLLAIASLAHGFRRHRRRSAMVLAAPGLGLIWFGSFGHWHHDLVLHAVLMTLGGTFIAFAHLRNLRLQRAAHIHDAACRHD
ncbi:MerC domain-containing protein [Aquimonas voraii]|uniref:MerC mercury resistance protein n=1 Tax=Aquimonas voraii TaxID=265719 RepID=A0A1G6XRP3_9GAMM|nr:MerC domain-containing protein [Aquimonas voraii]SDD80016.1 MerC mercury resistance protein [Aquimonas voraii]